MKIRTSAVTAQILKDHCDICDDLREQIDELPPQSGRVYLYTSRKEMEIACDNLKEYMTSFKGYNVITFELTLKELIYLASSDT